MTSDLHDFKAASYDTLMRDYATLEAEVERLTARVTKLEAALAHYATDEEPWGWVAIEALQDTALGEEDSSDLQ